MTFVEMMPAVNALSPEDRDKLSAYLTMLHREEHHDLAETQSRKLDRTSDWASLEALEANV